MTEVRMVLEAGDIVGESLVYDDRRDALVWVDIGGRRIHRLWLADRKHEIWPTPDLPACIGLDGAGDAVVGLRDRVALWRFGGPFETLAVVEPDLPDNRLNEGRVGPDGAFWVGTMQNNLNSDGSPREITRNSGAIYRVTREGRVEQMTPREFGITNTMAWTDDGLFLTADTLRNEIFAYESLSGELRSKRLFASGPERGFPDGSALDAEGRLWNCRVAGGSCLACFSRAGAIARFVDLPCSWPTSCAFGGSRHDTLYVTSARFTMSELHLAAHPQEGALFAVQGCGPGRAERRFL